MKLQKSATRFWLRKPSFPKLPKREETRGVYNKTWLRTFKVVGNFNIIQHITGPQTPTWVETSQYLSIINDRGKSISNMVSRRMVWLDVSPRTVGGPSTMSFDGMNWNPLWLTYNFPIQHKNNDFVPYILKMTSQFPHLHLIWWPQPLCRRRQTL